MPIVVGVKFRGTGKHYYFSPEGIEELACGDRVVVETARGRELGEVGSAPHEVGDAEVVGELKPILRKAGAGDLLTAERFQQQEEEVMLRCQEQVEQTGLEMKIVSAEYSFDGTRLTFFFTAEKRVDFRELVRDLARLFKTRIELRQIGVRDEAKLIGGIGKCGRPLCCATWLQEFSPVSIRMAKNQDLPLSPMEISGLCGRLLCCLTYEQETYRQIKAEFPREGKIVDTVMGPARLVKVKIFTEKALLRLEDGTVFEMTSAQLRGEEPYVAEPEPSEQEVRARGLEKALQANQGRGAPQAAPAAPVEQAASDDTDGQRQGSSNRSRRRRSGSSRRGQPRPQQGAAGTEGPTTEKRPEQPEGASEGRSRSSSRRRRRPPRSARPDNAQSDQQPRADGGGPAQPDRPRTDENAGPSTRSSSSRNRRRRRRPRNKPSTNNDSE